MGEVFLATDTRLDRKVAIKVLTTDYADNTDRLRRFEQEAKTLASLDHPNILSIFEVGTHEGAPYLVSQFLEGNALREELKNGALPQRKAIDYALQIAQGSPPLTPRELSIATSSPRIFSSPKTAG